MKERKRRMAHIVSVGKLAPSVCPNCSARLDAVTAARVGAFFAEPIKLKDNPTMCSYCGALLIFADDAGHVRAMTEAERDSVHLAPIVEMLYAQWRAEKTRSAGDWRGRAEGDAG